MANAQESYLSHTALGGGALFENSHATDFALFIANKLGFGRPRRVKASLIETEENGAVFDKEAILQVEMDEGLTLEIGQDLHSWPAKKFLAVGSKDEIYTWRMEPDADHVEYQKSLTDHISTTSFQKTRPDDFIPEMQHLLAILSDNNLPSPIDIHEVWHTTLTLEAALLSSRTQDWVDLSELEY